MSNIYVDLVFGNDSTGDGSNLNPYLTINKAVSMGLDNDTIRVAKTTAPSVISVSNTTWTYNTNTVATASTHVGTIAAGDYIGKTTAAGNGATETYYRVMSINATTITLEQKYCGTTETVASFNKLNPVTTGTAAQPACTISKAMTLSGGWTLATEVQDGETWFKSNNLRTVDQPGVYASASGVMVSKINIVETSRLIRLMLDSSSVSDCSGSGAQYYGIETNRTATLTNIRIIGSASASYASIAILASYDVGITNCHVTSYVGMQATTNPVRKTYTGITAECCTVGITGAINTTYTNMTAKYCTTGISPSMNTKIVSCDVYNNTTQGIYAAGAIGIVIDTCNIYNNNYGVSLATSNAVVIKNNTFTSNAYDVYGDQYSHSITAINNSHTTPTNYAYSKAVANSDTWKIMECTIDGPSIAKAFQIISNNNYISPVYAIQNSFGGLHGLYYQNGQVTRDTSTSPYSLQMALNTAATSALTEYKVGSCYANAGQEKTIGFELKANGAWSGSIIPMLQLNGKTITTGSAITSISSGSWDSHSLVAASGDLAYDGKLSLVFNYSANTVSINLRNFTVTDT